MDTIVQSTRPPPTPKKPPSLPPPPEEKEPEDEEENILIEDSNDDEDVEFDDFQEDLTGMVIYLLRHSVAEVIRASSLGSKGRRA